MSVIRMLVLAVIATLLPKVLGFVRCPKVDWPQYYVCFDDEYCCEDEQCCENSNDQSGNDNSGDDNSGDDHSGNDNSGDDPRNDHSVDHSHEHILVGAIVGISFAGFFFICLVVIACVKKGKRTQRLGAIHPSNDVGQQAAVVHISPHAEQTSEQITRIELPDSTTRLHQPTRVSTSSSRQQLTTTWTTVNPSEPYLPMYGHDSYSNPSPPPSYTSQPEYSPPPTQPPVTFIRRTGK